jgi:hypothetical protein
MFFDLIGATHDYWRKLDAVEAAYRRKELTAEEAHARIQQLMKDLGRDRRRVLREFWASLRHPLQRRGDALVGIAMIGLLTYLWFSQMG